MEEGGEGQLIASGRKVGGQTYHFALASQILKGSQRKTYRQVILFNQTFSKFYEKLAYKTSENSRYPTRPSYRLTTLLAFGKIVITISF